MGFVDMPFDKHPRCRRRRSGGGAVRRHGGSIRPYRHTKHLTLADRSPRSSARPAPPPTSVKLLDGERHVTSGRPHANYSRPRILDGMLAVPAPSKSTVRVAAKTGGRGSPIGARSRPRHPQPQRDAYGWRVSKAGRSTVLVRPPTLAARGPRRYPSSGELRRPVPEMNPRCTASAGTEGRRKNGRGIC